MSPNPTDYARWSKESTFRNNWSERAAFMARLIPPGLKVLDVGCGAMDFERFCRPTRYTPCDVIARDERTLVVDLNIARLPSAALEQSDIVACLGLLEYLADLPAFLRDVAAASRPILCSYCASDLSPSTDRAANGWLNALDRNAFEQLAGESGFSVEKRLTFGGNQAVYLLWPSSRAADFSQAPWAGARAAKSRPSLVLTGFLGRGNCGDEALLQLVHSRFQADYDIIVSVDELGAYKGFWDWHPYNACRIIHQTDLSSITDPACAGVVVVGGGLPVGFAAGQVAAAGAAGVPSFLTGADLQVGPRNLEGERANFVRAYLASFDRAIARTRASFELLQPLCPSLVWGGDWALLLEGDRSAEIETDAKRALVVLREFPIGQIPYAYIRAIERLLDGLARSGRHVAFAPFCPEDERFLAETGLGSLAPVERNWWNPARMKQLLASSGLVVTVGRLHPILFAAPTGAAVLSLAPPGALAERGLKFDKIAAACAELGVDHFASVEAAIAHVDAGGARPADPGKVAASTARLEAAAALLADRIAERRRSGALAS